MQYVDIQLGDARRNESELPLLLLSRSYRSDTYLTKSLYLSNWTNAYTFSPVLHNDWAPLHSSSQSSLSMM